MRHTTHKLTPEQKESLFTNHKDLIYMIHCFGGHMLRRQIRRLYHLLSDKDEKEVEFDIAELIISGFLLQKTINKDTRTQMLYLSKYPKSQFLDVECSGDVPAINWSNQKIFESIFKVDYIIEKVIPDMQKQDFNIDTDNIISYLNWNGSNLLLSNNQADTETFYNSLWSAFTKFDLLPADDFFRDLEIATYEKEAFKMRQSKKDMELPPCQTKLRRDKEMDSYNSDIEKSKQFYNLKHFASHGFYIESIQKHRINLCFFDSMNSIQTKKLYQQLCYILLMFQRYLNNYDVELHASVYTWDKDRAEKLQVEENKRSFDFYRQEWVDENKRHKVMKDVGLLPSQWENISASYHSEEIYSKYNVHL